jgi:glycosyltransferase involved in cell wall biosynthesis
MVSFSTVATEAAHDSFESHQIDVTLLIPVHNEEAVLPSLIEALVRELADPGVRYEMLLCENGSTDSTQALALEACGKHPFITTFSLPVASYGSALREGIRRSRGKYVVVFNADLWSKHFSDQAVELLETGVDLVIGSKRLGKDTDKRPFLRRAITASFNRMLNTCFGFRGTDTHGLKALNRASLLPIVESCVTSREVFDTELVLRAQRLGLAITEVPVVVEDTRPPRLSLLKRVYPTVVDLARIWSSLRPARTGVAQPFGIDCSDLSVNREALHPVADCEA